METSLENTKAERCEKSHPSNATIYPSVEHLAREIGISRHACYAAIRKGDIPHIKIGRRIILPKTAISDWLKNAGRDGKELDQTEKS